MAVKDCSQCEDEVAGGPALSGINLEAEDGLHPTKENMNYPGRFADSSGHAAGHQSGAEQEHHRLKSELPEIPVEMSV